MGRTNSPKRSGISTQVNSGELLIDVLFGPVWVLPPQGVAFPTVHVLAKLRCQLQTPRSAHRLPSLHLQEVRPIDLGRFGKHIHRSNLPPTGNAASRDRPTIAMMKTI
jgi:hypothetical protein